MSDNNEKIKERNVFEKLMGRFGYEKPQERGDVGIGGGASAEFKIDDRGRAPLKDLEWFYWNYGPLTRGLHLKSSSIWGRGFTIKSDNKQARELCENATLKISGFKIWVVTEALHSFIYGDGPGEMIWDDENVYDSKGKLVLDDDGYIKKKTEGKNIIGYNITDPKTFDAKWDKQGYVENWQQKIISATGDEDIVNHKPRKFCHFKFAQIADNVRGLGLIETNLSTIKALMVAEKATRDLLYRHGVPFVHVIKEGATAKDIPKLKKIGTKFNSSTSLASSEKIKIELKGVQGKSVDVKPHIDLLQDNLSGGLGIPKAILFFSGETVNRNTLTELLTMTSAEIKTSQERLSDIIEYGIFKPLLIANDMDGVEVPQVIWNPLDERGETEVLNNFKIFADAADKLFKAGVYTGDEIKKIIGEQFPFVEKKK